MGKMTKLGAVAPLKKRSNKERIASNSAQIAAMWKKFEETERVLEAFSRSQGYTCLLGPFMGALPPLPAAPIVDVDRAIAETDRAMSELQRAMKHTEKRVIVMCRSLGLAFPIGASSRRMHQP
ncbi:unnamed protein product [Linum tenue]|uniref:Uncharacterized protein n=1 Tax=Linum tenue TaxID=586396 RepID=A0AAV0NDI4_9ROSI|nr:unnamed protein product [Linum tenue]CAI0456598.1 unnamed protein product [Linum tenue]